MKFSQAPSALLMVRPKSFGFNPQTAGTNAFQQKIADHYSPIGDLAVTEFDKMVDLLHSNDIEVLVVEDTALPAKPDAIFPNNWISFHHDGTVVLYPMLAENRRAERSLSILDTVKKDFLVNTILDITSSEKQDKFLEGTGSIVFDYANRIAYASRSMRTDESVLEELCRKLEFKSIVFDATDEAGLAIYHTNVLMCIGTKFAIVCLDAIRNEADQDRILDSLAQTGHQVIAISFAQMRAFAGNMLEVRSKAGEPFVLLSEKSYHALLPGQLDALSKFADPVPIQIPTIEEYGGGSVRCMVAGIFNPGR